VTRELRGLLREFVFCAKFAGQAASFIFEGPDAEIGRRVPIGEIFQEKGFQAAAAFALRDVHHLMQEQLAVLPAIRPNNYSVPDRNTARRLGDDLSAARGLGQLLILRQRDPIHHEHPDAGTVLNAGLPRVGQLSGGERGAMFEDVSFLFRCPLAGKGREAFEFVLVDHANFRGLAASEEQLVCEARLGKRKTFG
jgi:hypothetical protein